MKLVTLLLISGLMLTASCKNPRGLSDAEKQNVRSEVRQFIKTVEGELETANADAYKKKSFFKYR